MFGEVVLQLHKLTSKLHLLQCWVNAIFCDAACLKASKLGC